MPRKKVTEEEAVVADETAKKTTKTSTTTAKRTKKTEEAPVVEAATSAIEDDVTVEKSADGIIEVKKLESNQNSAEEITIEQKLLSLYNLQQICSKIDDIRMIRGELPEEIRDNEDECEGKRTRIAKLEDEIQNLKTSIANQETMKADALASIKKYEEQQNNVRNNREYESLSKEIEYQKLEIQVADKHKAKFEAEIEEKEAKIAETKEKLSELEEVLNQKKAELEVIIADTEKEEEELLVKADELKQKVDDRLLTAFERIRKNAHNGLAIVRIERDACGGCFSKIPPQRQLDITLHKKIIVCEACGRIFIDDKLVRSQNAEE
ncbi:MAG: C4-type zinc ribbon domain-containing protein [Bacteroidales bacterium]|nr:C4-type zinc ribbon domain-containing protein [Bacteroidales bacterium]